MSPCHKSPLRPCPHHPIAAIASAQDPPPPVAADEKSVGGPVKKDYCKECKCLDPNPTAPHTCGQEKYKGDGNCDDDNNNAGCDFDGGDCCEKSVGGPVKKIYCKECKCLDPKVPK